MLLSDAAGLARIALRSDGGHMAPRRADALGAALHGLYWLTANIAAKGPVLLAIDDAHWADKPSLRWLAYLVARLEGLPVLVVMTVRPGEPGTPWGRSRRSRELGASCNLPRSAAKPPGCWCAPCSERRRPRLSASPATRRPRESISPALPARGAARSGRTYRTATSTESVTEIHSDSDLARGPCPSGPPAEIARELASAIAVFGASCSLDDAAAIAGLDADAAIAAADALAAQDVIVESEPLEFVHPIVRTAVYDEIPNHRRVRWHARAARLLDDADAPADEIAVHLLPLAPNADATVVGILHSAAAAALRAGAPESAVEYLTRALAEPPPARARVAILRELGAAEASLQDPAGAGHLHEALSLSSQPSERAEIARELAIPLMHSGQMGEAVDLLERAAGELAPGDRELQLELEADIIGAGRLHPALRRTALARVRALRAACLEGRTFGERVALSAVALELQSPWARPRNRSDAPSVRLVAGA